MKKYSPVLLNSLLFVILVTLIAAALLVNLADFSALSNPDGTTTDWRKTVLLDIRYPRLLLGIITGAVLGIAGNAMQGLLQNPLASPGLLGSSAGATTASVYLLYYFSASSVLLLLGGVVGALLAFMLTYCMARRHGATVMILAGVAVNSLLAASIAILLSNAKSPWALAELYRWMQGSLALAELRSLSMALPFVALGLFFIMWQRRYLDMLSFGEETAMTMGVNPKRAFFITALGAALCVGAVIPQTGAIGFIGLIAPHLSRMLLGVRPSRLYLSSALLGALLLLCADLLIWRTALFSRVYVGTLTAIIGAPFLVWILLRQHNGRRYD